MRKFYVLALAFLMSMTASAQSTPRILYWVKGDQTWPTTGSNNSRRDWADRRNWQDAQGNTASSDVANGDYLIIDGNRDDITINSDMTISFNQIVIEVRGGAEITISSGVTLSLSGAGSVFSLYNTSSGNGLTLSIRQSSSNPTQLILNGRVKALNSSTNTQNLYGSYVARGSETLSAGNTGFAGFNFGSLPAVLVNFTAQAVNNQVLLRWTTRQETNLAGFTVEKSTDAVRWLALGSVKATGFSGVSTDYSFTDANPGSQTAYYRVRMNDLDGKAGFTPIRMIRLQGSIARVSVFPNPASESVQVLINQQVAGNWRVQLINAGGQIVASQKGSGSNNLLSFNVQRLPAGQYLVKIRLADGSSQVSKLIVGAGR